MDLRVRLLTEGAPREAAVFLRQLGKGVFTRLPLPLVARGVHRVRLQTRDPGADFEYYVEVVDAGGRRVRWPATAPGMNHTVVRTVVRP